MPRIDAWDVQPQGGQDVIDAGFPRGFEEAYDVGTQLGSGGFGVVRVVRERATGTELAAKTIPKRLNVPNISAAKQAQHLENVKREVEVLWRLRASLNVAQFKGVFEDDADVHVLMEWCKGGELTSQLGRGHYSERTVASYIRAVLRTVAQCHSHRILHRDVKPGNFMLLHPGPRAPLKGIDFGLAVFFDPDKLPRTDLGLEGTPWYMAPEVLSCEVVPASDVWAAGVMAYQLLSGSLPFNDHAHPDEPALSIIWRSIFADKPRMSGAAWRDISEDAKSFVTSLLEKCKLLPAENVLDPRKRPTARDALQHRWLRGNMEDRDAGKPINQAIVQRLQRFGQGNALRKTIFELIAAELLKTVALPTPDPTVHAASQHGSGHGLSFIRAALRGQSPGHSQHGVVALEGSSSAPPQAFGTSPRRPSRLPSATEDDHHQQQQLQQSGGQLPRQAKALTGPAADPQSIVQPPPLQTLPRHNGAVAGGSAHANMEYYSAGMDASRSGRRPSYGAGMKRANSASLGWGANAHDVNHFRLMRAAAAAGLGSEGSPDGHGSYLHYAPRTEDERREQRKAARLALASASMQDLSRLLSSGSSDASMPAASDGDDPPWRQSSGSGDIPRGSSPPSGPLLVDLATFPEPVRVPVGPTPASSRTQPSSASAAELRGTDAEEEGGRRGRQGIYRRFLEESSGTTGIAGGGAADAAPKAGSSGSGVGSGGRGGVGNGGEAGRSQSALQTALQQQASESAGSAQPPQQPQQQQQQEDSSGSRSRGGLSRRPNSGSSRDGSVVGAAGGIAASPSLSERHVHFGTHDNGDEQDQAAAGPPLPLPPPSPPSPTPAFLDPHFPAEIRDIMRKLRFSRQEEGVAAEQLAEGLARLGYSLEPGEAARLLAQIGPNREGVVQKSEFLASQIDWDSFQLDYREQWLQAARRAFEGLDTGAAGVLQPAQLVGLLRDRLPAAEVEYAIEDALLQAGHADADMLDFDGFLRLLKVASSTDHLDQYESRFAASHSQHGGSVYAGHALELPTVAEDEAGH